MDTRTKHPQLLVRVDIEVCPPPQNTTQLASTILVLTVGVCVVFSLVPRLFGMREEEMSLGMRLCGLMHVRSQFLGDSSHHN